MTKNGHKVYSEFYSKLNLDSPKIKEDKDGYSEWQLWDLMHIFGSNMGLGYLLCFEPEILFNEKYLS